MFCSTHMMVNRRLTRKNNKLVKKASPRWKRQSATNKQMFAIFLQDEKGEPNNSIFYFTPRLEGNLHF